MSVLRSFGSREHGASLVEFALVAPVVILLLVACLDFARALNAYVTVANAGREAARYASLHPTADRAALEAFLASRVVPLDPTALTVTGPSFTRTADPRWVTGIAAPGVVSVTVRYRWRAATWIVGSFFAAGGSPTFASTSSTEATR